MRVSRRTFAAVEPRLDAIAVELDLVNPFVPARRRLVQRRRDWAERSRAIVTSILPLPCGLSLTCATAIDAAFVRVFLAPRACAPSHLRFAVLRPLDFALAAATSFRLVRRRPIAVPDALLALARRDLLDRAAGGDRAWLFLQNILVARAARLLVLALDQQPVLVPLVWPAPHAHEMPAAVQFLAVEFESRWPLA